MDPVDRLKTLVVTYSVRWSRSPGSCPLLNCRKWASQWERLNQCTGFIEKCPHLLKTPTPSASVMPQSHLFVFEGFGKNMNSPRGWLLQIQDLKVKSEGFFFPSANQEGAYLADSILCTQPCSTLVISYLQTSLGCRWIFSILQSRKLRHTGVNQLSMET